MTEEDCNFTCPQCPKIFATRSNLKRHMENPNIHNIPYARSRDQKRWKGHSKKVSSRAETTERMRKWRAENRDKNKRNDLRCRVYRLARQKYGEEDSEEKQQFINDEINRRLGRRMLLEEEKNDVKTKDEEEVLNELPFYCAPLHKIELPSINMERRSSNSTTEPSEYNIRSQPPSPNLSENTTIIDNSNNRRYSGCSSSNTSVHSHPSISTSSPSPPTNTITLHNNTLNNHHPNSLPPMQSFLTSLQPPQL